MEREAVPSSIRRALCAILTLCAAFASAPAWPAEIPLSKEEIAWLAQHKQITVGAFDPGWLPFENLDKAGNLEGLAPDYLRIVAGKLDLEIVPKRFVSWTEARAAACSGEVDLLMNVALVPEWTHCLAFTPPYIDVPNVVIGPSTLGRIDDARISRSRISVEAGFATSAGIAERFPAARQVIAPNVEMALRAIAQERSDLYIGNPYVAARLLKENEFSDLAILRDAGTPFSTLHFAVAEREKPLAGAISKALATIDAPEHEAIRSKWLESSAAFDHHRGGVVLNQRERAWLHELPPLRVGFNSSWDAISPEVGRQLGGISGEYARILEERLGLHFVAVPVRGQPELARLISQRKIDLAVTTRGRALTAGWSYTDPILSLANVIVARNDRATVTGAADLNGLRVATVGPERKARVLEAAPGANVILVDTAVEGMRRVEVGTVDIYVGDVVTVNRTLRDGGMPLQIVAPAGFEEDIIFAVSPGRGELVPIINRLIGGMSNEEHQRIRSGWLQLNVQYGMPWRKFILGMVIAALITGALTFAYVRVRREMAGRKQAMALIRDLTRNLPGVVFKISVDGDGGMRAIFVGGNTREIFALTATDIQESVSVLLERFRPEDRRRLVSALRDETATSIHLFLMVGERWLRMSAAPRKLDHGQVWTGYWADATEEQAQLDALAAAKVSAELAANTKATFLATMSHEIRTPMSGLGGLLELLGRSELASEQRRMLDLAAAAARSLRELLDEILDYSRIESGRLRVEKANMRTRDLLCEAVLLMSGAAEQRGIRVECHIDPTLAAVLEGDESRIRQIVINFLSNAIKFTEHGHVAVRATVSSQTDNLQTWSIEVSDTGIGISGDDLERLFQPFVQAQSNTTGRLGGSGLGLVISKRLAELMGGSVTLNSEVGRGTTARLDLQNVIVELDDSRDALRGKRVLLVCSNAATRAAVRGDLGTLGTTLVTDPGSADLIITDESEVAYTDAPVIYLVMAPPLAVLSAQHYVLACEPVLFTAVRDICLRALEYALPPDHPAAGAIGEVGVDVGGLYVLVAEDDPTNQVLIGGQLAELGYRCLVADDGVAALQAWERERFDLLITDMQMPRLDGIGLAAEIRRREAATGSTRMPIIALTAGAFPEDVARCLANGMDDHLAKPASLATLSSRLRKWIKREQAPGVAPHEGGQLVSRSIHELVVRAFGKEASMFHEEIDLAMSTDDPHEIGQAMHRVAGALASVGHKSTAKRIRRVMGLMERAGGVHAARGELVDLHREISACIEETAARARNLEEGA
ncbi:ATP-binding protein [Stenotrophomonas sp. AB1(2024)]|uniref:ATP-binding protein n=1 Tax=Stenotrophomonas sp. AB1(2024) TaxID=3132215 RepID=UPI0030ACDEAB